MIDLGLDIYRTVGRCADRLGLDAYAVGGVVRDHFLQRPCTDIDSVCVPRESELPSDYVTEISGNTATQSPSHPETPSIGIVLGGRVKK